MCIRDRLPNGYHDLDMTMQAITLYERVVLRRSPYLNLRLPGSLVAPNNKNTCLLYTSHVWPDEPIESYNDALACVLRHCTPDPVHRSLLVADVYKRQPPSLGAILPRGKEVYSWTDQTTRAPPLSGCAGYTLSLIHISPAGRLPLLPRCRRQAP